MKPNLIFMLLLSSLPAFGQTNLAEIETKLTNGKTKQWILKDTKTLAPSCENGMVYTFLKTKHQQQLQAKECRAGQWQPTTFTWELKLEGDLDVVLLLREKAQKNDPIKYYVRFIEKEGKEYLRLRLLGKDKSQESKDYDFYHGSK
jgi:hypothetical protein